MEIDVTQKKEIIASARREIEKSTGKSPEQLFEERQKRITDVIQLRVPDRMPVYMRGNYFALKYAGLPPSAAFYDPMGHTKAMAKMLIDFDPDVFKEDYGTKASGLALEKLGSTQYLWPGGPLRLDQHSQFLDMAIMKEDEYDLFITDPSDFALRYYLPREWKALAPLSKLPAFKSLVGSLEIVRQSSSFSSPDVVRAFETIFQAGRDQEKFEHEGIAAELGIPEISYPGPVIAPFDLIADYLRGMTGVSMDMFKRPEKLLLAMDRLVDWHLARAVLPSPTEKGTKRVSGAGDHWGSKEFLSKKQFLKFYWPAWKKSLMAAIDMGYIPVMHPEGSTDDRIECFLELPKGKALLWNEVLDVKRAKEILGGHLAFMGGVPASLLWGGSPQEVDEYCKDLIKVCGKGGGYILSCAGVEDDAKPANLKAMMDAVRKYGRY